MYIMNVDTSDNISITCRNSMHMTFRSPNSISLRTMHHAVLFGTSTKCLSIISTLLQNSKTWVVKCITSGTNTSSQKQLWTTKKLVLLVVFEEAVQTPSTARPGVHNKFGQSCMKPTRLVHLS